MSSTETLDSAKKKIKNSATFKTVSTLSYIGNGLWAFLFLLLFVGCIINGAAVMKTVSMDNFFGGTIMLFTVFSGTVVLLCLLAIRGLLKMKNGKRRGFFLYAIANGLWALLLFYADKDDVGSIFWIGGIISLVFIGYYALLLHKLH